jgi:hypothetical protein
MFHILKCNQNRFNSRFTNMTLLLMEIVNSCQIDQEAKISWFQDASELGNTTKILHAQF